MTKELGDGWIGSSGVQLTTTEESSSTNMSAGDAVSMDGSQQVTPTTDGADVYGVVAGPADDSVDLGSLSAGDEVSVVVHGPVIANAGGSVTRGDLLETSSTSGQLAQNSTGTEVDVDEGGTDTYTIAQATAKAMSNSGGTINGHSLGANEAAVFVL
jgi:hypothetical protein